MFFLYIYVFIPFVRILTCGLLLLVFAVLLKNVPTMNIDKSRALYLARTRAPKKKEGDDVSGTLAASTGSAKGEVATIAPNLEVISAQKVQKRAAEKGSEEKAPKRVRRMEKLPVQVIENSSDEEKEADLPKEIVRTRGVPTEIGGFVSSGSGLVPYGSAPPATGTVGYSLTQFQAGRGWLGDPSEGRAPLEALNIFSLSPDKERLAAEDDDKLLNAVQEVLGQVLVIL